MTRFIDAYDKRTGRKLDHPVPEHWFDVPALAKDLSKTPRQEARETKARKGIDKPATGEAEKEQ